MAGTRSNLIMDIKPGESLDLGGLVRVELVQKSGRIARLKVTAPKDVEIRRSGEPIPESGKPREKNQV